MIWKRAVSKSMYLCLVVFLLIVAAPTPTTLTGACPQGSSAQAQDYSSVAGDYVCESIRGKPGCANSIRLLENGYWGYVQYSGKYEVRNGRVIFVSGNGGPVTWGSAIIGPDTLTIGDVVYRRPAKASDDLFGSYYCKRTGDGHPCPDKHPLVLDKDGTWTWQSTGGTYSVLGNRVKFVGPTWSPATWGDGMADIGKGTLSFKARGGPSIWAK